jgi:hypothetical protein
VGKELAVGHASESVRNPPRQLRELGNARHGVALPYNYWSKSDWSAAFDQLGLNTRAMKRKLDLYPIPLSWFFDRSLHFIAFCERGNSPSG